MKTPKSEKVKSIINVIVSILTAFITAIGTTSCVVDIKPPAPALTNGTEWSAPPMTNDFDIDY